MSKLASVLGAFVLKQFIRCLTSKQGNIGMLGIVWAPGHSTDLIPERIQCVRLEKEKPKVRGQIHSREPLNYSAVQQCCSVQFPKAQLQTK